MLPNISVTVDVFCDWSLYNVLLGFKENYSKSRGFWHTQFNHKVTYYSSINFVFQACLLS